MMWPKVWMEILIHAARNRAAVAAVVTAGVLALSGCVATVETSWAPDAKAIAYWSDGKLRIYDVETKESRPLDTGPEEVLSAAWSPDGKAIAFYAARWGDEGSVSLRAIEPASGQIRTLAAHVWPLPQHVSLEDMPAGAPAAEALRDEQASAAGTLAYAPAISWSTDGERVAFVSARPGCMAISVMDYQDGTVKQIREEPAVLALLSWAPDGKHLACVRISSDPVELGCQEEGTGDPTSAGEPDSLWLYDASSGELAKMCDLPADGIIPAPLQWSADSSQIGFVRETASSDMGIGCIVDARPGATMRQEVRGITTEAAWSPGLTGVAFLEKREDDEVVLIFRGVRPVTRKVLGVLRAPKLWPPDDEQDEESEGTFFESSPSYSLPQFSPDGRYVALRVGQKGDETRIEVFPVL